MELLGSLITFLMACIYLYELLQSRYERKKTGVILIAGNLGIIVLNYFIYLLLGRELFYKLYPVTTNLTSFLLFNSVTRYRGFKTLFNILTVMALCCLITFSGAFFSLLFNVSPIPEALLNLFVRIVCFLALLYIIHRYFRTLYFSMLGILDKGWGLYCIIPMSSYAVFYILGVKNITQGSANLVVDLFTLSFSALTLAASYGVIGSFFLQIRKQTRQESENQLLKAQISALNNQSKLVADTEEKIRIYRHDMRHYIRSILTLLESNNAESAIDFVKKCGELFEHTKLIEYCENTTVNAILSYYLRGAEQEDIKIKYRLDIPEHLPVDALELSAIFANAIENARSACRKLPEGEQRKIELTCVSCPHFIFEIANSYDGKIKLDGDFIPLASENGHGIGTQSIVAFAKKYHAVLDYQTDNCWFRLRMLIPAHEHT
jgi:signal transduction histidine kinase